MTKSSFNFMPLTLSAFGFLLSGNLFFVVRLIDTVERGSKSLAVMEERVSGLQNASAGIMDMRIELSILKNKVDRISATMERREG
jgi:hypothetical protein